MFASTQIGLSLYAMAVSGMHGCAQCKARNSLPGLLIGYGKQISKKAYHGFLPRSVLVIYTWLYAQVVLGQHARVVLRCVVFYCAVSAVCCFGRASGLAYLIVVF